MAQIGYLLRRLPPLTADMAAVPIGPEEFSDLVLDGELKHWAVGVLDWLRLANRRHEQRKLPPPYPDARSAPRMSWPDEPWAAYYERFTSIAAPSLIRGWMTEDMACITARSAVSGRALGLPVIVPVDRRLDTAMQPGDAALASAVSADKMATQFHFHWLDEHVFTSAPDSADHVYCYALKLLVLLRNGLRLERDEAA